MKKLILLILLFASSLSASPMMTQLAGSGGAAAACTWQTAWSTTDDTDGDTTERNFRQVIPASASSYSGTKVRLTYKATAAGNWTVDGASIGVSTSNDDFDTAPTRITFSGSNSGTVTAGSTLVSDEIAFAFTKTNRHLVHTWTQVTHIRYNNDTGGPQYYTTTSGDGTTTQTVSYSTLNYVSMGPIKVEVCVP